MTSQEDHIRVYIAGPLFNDGERWYLERIDAMCRRLGLDTYLPHRDAGLCPASGDGGEFYFRTDWAQLRQVNLVIAVLNGSCIDPGTAWEIGYAYAEGCPVIGVFDDTRIDNPQASINLMIYHSVELCDSLQALEARLREVYLGTAASTNDTR